MEEILKPYLNKSINIKDIKVINKLKTEILKFSFFKKIIDLYPNVGDLICFSILKNLIFLEYLPNQIILKKGDVIKNIYIIFTGEIYIFDEPELIDEKYKKENKLESKSIIKNNFKKGKNRQNIFNNIYNIYDINIIPNSTLSPGNSIGESFNYSEPNFSDKIIRAGKKSIIGYIKYSKYNQIMENIGNLEANQTISFIKNLNLFGNMNNFIEKMKQYIQYKRYEKALIYLNKEIILKLFI